MSKTQRIISAIVIALLVFSCSSTKQEQETPVITPKPSKNHHLLTVYKDSLQLLQKQLKEMTLKIDSLKTSKQNPTVNFSPTKTDHSEEINALKNKITNLKALLVSQEKDSIEHFNQKTFLSNKIKQQNKALESTTKKVDSLVKLLSQKPKSPEVIHDTLTQVFRDTIVVTKNSDLLQAKIDSLIALLQSEDRVITKSTVLKPEPTSKNNLSEAFSIYLAAKKSEQSDPTLSLRLLNHALQLSDDTIISSYYDKLRAEKTFYTNILLSLPSITQISFGDERLITIFTNDLANYYDFSNPDSPSLLKDFDMVSSAFISPNKGQMILGRSNGSVSIYSINREDIIKHLAPSTARIPAVSIIGNALYFYTYSTSYKTLVVLNKKFEEVANMVGMKQPVTEISVDPKTGYLATSSGDLNPRIWSPSGKLLLKLEDQSDSTLSTALSPSSKQFVSTHANGLAKLWTIEGVLLCKFNKHGSAITACDFGSEQLIATGDRSGDILIWNNYGDVLYTLKGHQREITTLKFTDPTTLYSSSLDGSVKRWKLNQSKNEIELPPLTDAEKKRFKIN